MSNSKSRSGQKFIARNRAPRVQIEYDVEIYGAERKIQLPFVMGVMADLVGKAVDPQASVEERKFMEIDVDNFDERMKSLKPRVAYQVDNTLTGEGKLNIDLTFESMEDFSCRYRPQGRLAGQSAGRPHPAFQPAVLYGRQERRRRADLQDPAKPGAAAIPDRRAEAGG